MSWPGGNRKITQMQNFTYSAKFAEMRYFTQSSDFGGSTEGQDGTYACRPLQPEIFPIR